MSDEPSPPIDPDSKDPRRTRWNNLSPGVRPSPQIMRGLLVGLAIFLLGYAYLAHRNASSHSARTADLSQLIGRVEQEPASITRVVFNAGSLLITATLKNGDTVSANYPNDLAAAKFQTLLERQKIDFGASAPSHSSLLTSVLVSLLPLLLIAGIWIYVMRRMRRTGGMGQVMSFGKSKAKRLAPDLPTVGFKDVAGVDEAVEELEEIKDFLTDPKRFQALGARIPKGVLLYGPPGTGKTLLARAVAGEAGVPFFSISGSDFVEMFVGVGASRVRDLFSEAKTAAPCIVFVDELDAVGRHRGAGIGGGNDEREQTLNQLLVEMDGFSVNQNIILIAATNRPDILDPALLRPGRFDRQIMVDRPDRNGRRQILAVHTRGKPLEPGVDLDVLAAGTPGFTGAELSNLINEAALLSARRDRTTIGQHELEEGVMRVIAGPEKKARVFSELERRVTAYHEMGHALVGHFLEHTDPVHKISIVSRGQALGLTVSLPIEDRFLSTRSALLDQLAMILGGRAAEELVFQEVTTGAANDLEKATAMSRQMITRFGMSDKLGPRVFGADPRQPFLGRELGAEPSYSDEMAHEIDEEIFRLIDDAHQRAAACLLTHEQALHAIAAILIDQETIEREQFEQLLLNESLAGQAAPALGSAPKRAQLALASPPLRSVAQCSGEDVLGFLYAVGSDRQRARGLESGTALLDEAVKSGLAGPGDAARFTDRMMRLRTVGLVGWTWSPQDGLGEDLPAAVAFHLTLPGRTHHLEACARKAGKPLNSPRRSPT